MTLKVLIIEDHPMFRDALAEVIAGIEEGVEIWQAGSGEDGLRMAHENGEPDLVLVDLTLPGMDGVATARAFGAAYPALPLVVVTGSESQERLAAALKAGAASVVSKAAPARELRHTLRQLLNGELLTPSAARTTGRAPPAGPAGSGRTSPDDAQRVFNALTLRHIEVLNFLAQGMSNKEIALQLNVTDRTVKAHITKLFKTLGVVNRTQATLTGQSLGLVKSGEHGISRST